MNGTDVLVDDFLYMYLLPQNDKSRNNWILDFTSDPFCV